MASPGNHEVACQVSTSHPIDLALFCNTQAGNPGPHSRLSRRPEKLHGFYEPLWPDHACFFRFNLRKRDGEDKRKQGRDPCQAAVLVFFRVRHGARCHDRYRNRLCQRSRPAWRLFRLPERKAFRYREPTARLARR